MLYPHAWLDRVDGDIYVVILAPRTSDVSLDSGVVEWQAIRPMGHDSIIYCLQLQYQRDPELEYKPVCI